MKFIDLRKDSFKDLEDFLAVRRQGGRDVTEIVKKIVDDVKSNGDAALIKYSGQFDGVSFSSGECMKVSKDEIQRAYKELESDLIDIIRRAADNIEEFHRKQTAESFIYEKEPGIKLGTLRRPLGKAGIYVPAGTAPLPSSVLMNALPAKVAGVKNIVMATPPGKTGVIHPAILVAADIAGISEIYKVGGAQAIAAFAYGTETIPKADIITGPGNIYVAAAKKMVYGDCKIDMIAGPSEILIVADRNAYPEYIAADMLSQAEHDKLAASILITTDEILAENVKKELTRQLTLLRRKDIAESSLENYGAIVVAEDIDQAIDAANAVAPEHLELCIANEFDYLNRIESAGAVFLGNYTPEPLGDYYAGPNHVLPTTGAARFFSPLNVWDFIKQTSVISYSKEALADCADDIIKFARAEQLDAHAGSIEIRKD